MISYKEILQELDTFPPLTSAVQETIHWIQQSQRNPADIIKIIEENDHLAASVLSIANSDYFNKNKKIESLHDVIDFLGEETFFQITVAIGTIDWFQKSVLKKQNPSQRLWDHCLAVGVGIEQLALILDIKNTKYLFISGFLHDIGKALLESNTIIDTDKIVDLSDSESLSVDEAERKILGIDHMEIGATILSKWDMPSIIVNAVRWHHQPTAFNDVTHQVDMLHVADAIALMMGICPQSEGMNYRICTESAKKLKISNDLINNVIFDNMDKFDPLKGSFAPLIGEVV